MSNIPNSAMPHAWAHEDEQEDEGSEGFPVSFGTVALAGAGALLLYWLFGRK
jgi:hypothetical protein